MSDAPRVRRADEVMSDDEARATPGSDGWPYVVPLLYVCPGEEVWVHDTSAGGHCWRRPSGFSPRLDDVAARRPAVDQTKSPGAVPP